MKDPSEARLSEKWLALDNTANRSYHKPNNESNNELGKSVVCGISTYNLNVDCTECVKCLNWVHCLCESFFSQSTSLSDNGDFHCLCYRSYHSQTSIRDCFVVKSNENSEQQRKLKLDIAELKCQYQILRDSTDSNVGGYELQLLETLNSIKVACPAYHENVFLGNPHCKFILNNYEILMKQSFKSIDN